MSVTTKRYKVIKLTITDLAADGMLADGNGKKYFDVSDMDVERVIMEHNITGLTGTNVIFKALTTSDPNNSGATTDAALVGADGSTAFVSATITAAGRGAKAISLANDGGANCSNLGTKIGVWADTTSITDLDGELFLVIIGK